jgi:hypothetical protein
MLAAWTRESGDAKVGIRLTVQAQPWIISVHAEDECIPQLVSPQSEEVTNRPSLAQIVWNMQDGNIDAIPAEMELTGDEFEQLALAFGAPTAEELEMAESR